jgi:aspartate carbamoyltransferase catalytic subunit
MHVLSADQFDQTQLESYFAQADTLRIQLTDLGMRSKLASRYKGRNLCSLFYEPSTRTRISFETAAVKFGMGVVSTENAEAFSSAAKGETLEDTIRVLNEYDFDIIVLRHHETGAAARAAAVSEKATIINAGDGRGQHPTQALLDLYTIHREVGRVDKITVALGTDLLHSRTIRSLIYLLSSYADNHLILVSPKELKISTDVKAYLKKRKVSYEETADLEVALKKADVVYWNRIQKERFKGDIPSQTFIITKEHLHLLKPQASIMNPLPRIDEITVDVDEDPRAAYFRQAGNGLYIRMALISAILDARPDYA